MVYHQSEFSKFNIVFEGVSERSADYSVTYISTNKILGEVTLCDTQSMTEYGCSTPLSSYGRVTVFIQVPDQLQRLKVGAFSLASSYSTTDFTRIQAAFGKALIHLSAIESSKDRVDISTAVATFGSAISPSGMSLKQFCNCDVFSKCVSINEINGVYTTFIYSQSWRLLQDSTL